MLIKSYNYPTSFISRAESDVDEKKINNYDSFGDLDELNRKVFCHPKQESIFPWRAEMLSDEYRKSHFYDHILKEGSSSHITFGMSPYLEDLQKNNKTLRSPCFDKDIMSTANNRQKLACLNECANDAKYVSKFTGINDLSYCNKIKYENNGTINIDYHQSYCPEQIEIEEKCRKTNEFANTVRQVRFNKYLQQLEKKCDSAPCEKEYRLKTDKELLEEKLEFSNVFNLSKWKDYKNEYSNISTNLKSCPVVVENESNINLDYKQFLSVKLHDWMDDIYSSNSKTRQFIKGFFILPIQMLLYGTVGIFDYLSKSFFNIDYNLRFLSIYNNYIVNQFAIIINDFASLVTLWVEYNLPSLYYFCNYVTSKLLLLVLWLKDNSILQLIYLVNNFFNFLIIKIFGIIRLSYIAIVKLIFGQLSIQKCSNYAINCLLNINSLQIAWLSIITFMTLKQMSNGIKSISLNTFLIPFLFTVIIILG